MEHIYLTIALDTPLDRLFDYKWQSGEEKITPQVGQLALVPFGRQELMGVIVGINEQTDVPDDKIKEVIEVRSQCSPLSKEWLQLCQFAAEYYQRPLGEVAVPALPKNLRVPKTTSLDRQLKKLATLTTLEADDTEIQNSPPALNSEQQFAVNAICAKEKFTPFLLYGVTGSGKTEVYLQAAAHMLAQDECSQVLILVPEINLTPQLEANLRKRFTQIMIATLHSGMAEGERLLNWLAAHTGKARIILGTRLAILASLPHLKMIVIDEEHDPSYKQQEGLRYSARDLAVWRAHQLGIPVVLGSATPSLETWQHTKAGRYTKLRLAERAVKAAVLPVVKLINLEHEKPSEGLTQRLISAMKLRLEKGEQSLLFLNRRGYAPVIACDACGWISDCSRCTAHMVLHKLDKKLRCHHCGLEQRIHRNCPTCGNVDLQPLGRGTQRLEESLQSYFPRSKDI